MKRFFFFAALLFAATLTAQQTPYFPVDNYTQTSGAQTVTAPYGMLTPSGASVPVTISQAAQTDFIAGTRMNLKPGFSAGSFSNGYFHGQIGAAVPFDVAFIEPDQNTPYVGQFNKLEIGMSLPAVLDQQVNDFLANGTGGINPFDPDQISVEALFQYGNTSYTVYGFYYDEFIRDPAAIQAYPTGHPEQKIPAHWLSQATAYHWRIRFAPPEIGGWNCSISIRLNNAATVSYQVNNLVFNCVPSGNPGYLKIGDDHRHLVYSGSDGNFFAIGQNIAWCGAVFRGGYPMANFPQWHDDGFLDELDYISAVSDYGGNMVRVVNMDNTFELEHQRLGNYSDRMDHAWELDRLIELCEQKNVKLSLQMADLRFGDNNDEFGWPDNPYHTQIPLDEKKHFYTDATAKDFFKKKLRYFLSRWGYSTSVGIFSLVGEIDSHIDPMQSLREDQTVWFEEFFTLAKAIVSYRSLLTTTSYKSGTYASDYHRFLNLPLETPFDLDECDITTMHSYHAERKVNRRRFNEFYEEVAINSLGLLPVWDKPAYFEEIGVCTEPGCTADANDFEGCSDINMHNSLWASAFMNGFGTCFPWWQWHRNDYRQNNYPALHAFFNGIDFQAIKFSDAGFWDDALIHSNSTIETFYIMDKHCKQVMGWVHNTSYWWGNTDQNCSDHHGNSMDLPNDDDTPNAPQSLSTNTKFEIKNLSGLQNYTLDWYLTGSTGGLYQQYSYTTNIFGVLKPYWKGIYADWAFKAYRAGNNFRLSNEITSDTLLCGEDTVTVNGNYSSDTLKTFHYHWNFGNGVESFARDTFLIYNKPGTYLVTLIVSDSLGWSDTLRQYIVKPEPCNAERKAAPAAKFMTSWNAFPNPASTSLELKFDSTWSSPILVELYALDGRRILLQSINSSDEELPMNQFFSGCYMLRVTDFSHSDVKRIIITH